MSKRILIVDDDNSISESLRFLLEDEGYTVSASDDSTFISNKQYRDELRPDLILLDYWLPGENGGEISKKLKKDNVLKNIPIIIVSASMNIKELVLEAGANDFLPKPYDIDDLLRMMQKHLKN